MRSEILDRRLIYHGSVCGHLSIENWNVQLQERKDERLQRKVGHVLQNLVKLGSSNGSGLKLKLFFVCFWHCNLTSYEIKMNVYEN